MKKRGGRSVSGEPPGWPEIGGQATRIASPAAYCIFENLQAERQEERLLLGGCRFGGPQVGTPVTHSNK